MRFSLGRHLMVGLTALVVVAAVFSCRSKTSVQMKAFGNPNASVNREPPVVTLVSSTNVDGNYVTGDKITITVKFSKPVFVTGAGHITLLLATGYDLAVANYQSGSDSDTLQFDYQVLKDDRSSDLQYIDEDGMDCDLDTAIRDDKAHDAILTLPSTSDASSLGGQKNISINTPSSAVVDQNAGVFDDLGLHFEKSVYQTLSTKRLLIKASEVAGMTGATVLVGKDPYACTVTEDFNATLGLASLGPIDMSAVDAALAKSPYGVMQTVTLELDGTGITPNQTTEQIMLKDFTTFSLGSSGFGAAQIKNGFQGWMGPIMGARTGGDTQLITGYLDVVNR